MVTLHRGHFKGLGSFESGTRMKPTYLWEMYFGHLNDQVYVYFYQWFYSLLKPHHCAGWGAPENKGTYTHLRPFHSPNLENPGLSMLSLLKCSHSSSLPFTSSQVSGLFQETLTLWFSQKPNAVPQVKLIDVYITTFTNRPVARSREWQEEKE